ncbi:hypothetical protein [Phaeovulum sp. W22_SRMD_FR3]|uniref:hypothetical protein n=1 Tax=Phaeovulum sp. W22_SRMD_FR3 TaxID=3240274 RepID=UPI003F9B9E79
MDSKLAQTLEEMEDLFQVERHTIRTGDFDALPGLALKKAELLERLEGTPPEALRHLRSKAETNQRLLSAALKGVRAAQRRLEMIQRASRSLNSYDALGRARIIGSGPSSIDSRA